ncbi:MAG: colanic acid biosynthesis glycosyltransferase WcaL, partial [Microcoleus sp.]
MNIAYLVNQYPKVSHSFVRREVLAVEACGLKVARFSIRSCEAELVDKGDKQEQELTKVILGVGVKGLVLALLRVAVAKPAQFLEALRLTFQVGWHSERGIILHLAYLAEACVLLNWFAEQEIA